MLNWFKLTYTPNPYSSTFVKFLGLFFVGLVATVVNLALFALVLALLGLILSYVVNYLHVFNHTMDWLQCAIGLFGVYITAIVASVPFNGKKSE